jgi:hypothetical protein
MLLVAACTADSNGSVVETALPLTAPVENRATATPSGDDGTDSTPQLAELAPTPTPTDAAGTIILNERSVIFPADVVEEWWWFMMGYREAGAGWTPKPDQVAALEAALTPFLKTADDPWLRSDPPIWERVPQYQGQFIGLIEDGWPIIYGNYFCNS